MHAPSKTPLRALALARHEGCRLLSETNIDWRDGGEGEVRAIVAAAEDLSSLSDELALHDAIWETRYHLARERSYVMRVLDISEDAAVLEVGAGCGAVTRYLGETAATVDALEPVRERAEVARLRCRDLDSVEVFIGELDAVPPEPAYDLIVLVGVLEYVGGRDDLGARVRLLGQAAARLRTGGAIACAIENRLGVQYLAGASEEHLGRPFEGLEGYPRAGPVRTFARAELDAIFRRAGLTPRTLHVFPDYKFARLVYDDSLLATDARPLAWRVPTFPSQASPHHRPRLAAEALLWRGLVKADLGGEFANSFLVVAGVGENPPVWPTGRHATFFSTNRRSRFVTETHVRSRGAEIVLERRRLGPARSSSASGLEHRCEDSIWTSDEPLLERLERADVEETAKLLGRWRAHVERMGEATGPIDIDAGPHHALLDGAEEIRIIDQEWFSDRYSSNDVIGRGLLHLALQLADRCPPERWPSHCASVGDLVPFLAGLAGAEACCDDLGAVVQREAEMLVEVTRCAPGADGWESSLYRQLEHFAAELDRPLWETALGRRDVVASRADPALQDAYDALVGSRSWRLTSIPRRVASWVRPGLRRHS